MGWKGGLLLELQKSSVLSDAEVPRPVSPLSDVPGRRPKRLWNFSDTAGVCHSMSANRAASLDSIYRCEVVIPYKAMSPLVSHKQNAVTNLGLRLVTEAESVPSAAAAAAAVVPLAN